MLLLVPDLSFLLVYLLGVLVNKQLAGYPIQLLEFLLINDIFVFEVLTGVEEVPEFIFAELFASGDSAGADAGHVFVEGGVGHDEDI